MKSGRDKFLTIYTLSFSENIPDFGLDHYVLGSYLSRGDAIRECAKAILEKIEDRRDFRMAFLDHSDNDIRKMFEEKGVSRFAVESAFSRSAKVYLVSKIRDILMDFLVDVIGGDSCYSIETDGAELQFRFDVDENDVESDNGLHLWTCITSGRDEEENDPEFENAFPETFLTLERAIQCAVDDLRGYLEGYSRREVSDMVKECREKLRKDGHYEYMLNDMKKRIWDVWSTPVDIGQGTKGE